MCGINGIYAYRGSTPPSARELIATRDAMASRGADGFGEWWSADSRCGFGHRRLSIIDLSDLAAQPMVSADGLTSITFNGEIYNYRELRNDLIAAGVKFRTTSDTEVLLHLYAQHGRDMVDKLRGMFTFGIFDARRSGLLLARDPFGIKPLYYADDGHVFRFASQVKSLLKGGAISREIEAAGLTGFCLYGSVPEPFTLYRGVNALPAGHTCWIGESGTAGPKPYVNLAEIFAKASTATVAPDIDSEVRAAVLDSVRAHLVADVEVGLFLSSGIDSVALLGLMRDAGQHDIRAITLGFEEYEGTNEDEVPLASVAAKKFGARHVVQQVTRRQFAEQFGGFLEAMDQPSIDGVNTWFVASAARACGLKVALSGLGGDELLGGYPSFSDVPRWRRRFGPLAKIPGAGWLARKIVGHLAPGFAAAQPKALGMLELSGTWAGAYMLRRGLFLPQELGSVLDPEIVREGMQKLKPLQCIAKTMEPDPGSDFARVSVLESSNYMRNQLLRDADWAGMAHGIEIRTPLVDIELQRRLAPLVPHLKAGQGKRALARAPSTPLPSEIVNRKKTGFFVPIGSWMDAALRKAPSNKMARSSKGLVARDWSRAVLGAFQHQANT